MSASHPGPPDRADGTDHRAAPTGTARELLHFVRADGDVLHLRDGDGKEIGRFDTGRAGRLVRLLPEPGGGRVAAIGVPREGRAPRSARSDHTVEDVWLSVHDLHGEASGTVVRGHVQDAIWTPRGDLFAFERNTVVRADLDGGKPEVLARIGQLNFGPKSMSLCPGGGRIALYRWRGDRKLLTVIDLATGGTSTTTASCYRYQWLDEDRIVMLLAAALKVLDVRTGAISTLTTSGRLDKAVGNPPQDASTAHTTRDTFLGAELAVHGGHILVVLTAVTHGPGDASTHRETLLRLTLDGQLEEVVEDCSGGRLTYVGRGAFRIEDGRMEERVGPEGRFATRFTAGAPPLAREGWDPILTPYRPEEASIIWV